MALGIQKILVMGLIFLFNLSCKGSIAGGGAESSDDAPIIVAPLFPQKPSTKPRQFVRERHREGNEKRAVVHDALVVPRGCDGNGRRALRRSASLSSDGSELLSDDEIVWPHPTAQEACSLQRSNSGSFSSDLGYFTPPRRGSTPEGAVPFLQSYTATSSVVAAPLVQPQVNIPANGTSAYSEIGEVALLQEKIRKLQETIQGMDAKLRAYDKTLFRYESTLLGFKDFIEDYFSVFQATGHTTLLARLVALEIEVLRCLGCPPKPRYGVTKESNGGSNQ